MTFETRDEDPHRSQNPQSPPQCSHLLKPTENEKMRVGSHGRSHGVYTLPGMVRVAKIPGACDRPSGCDEQVVFHR
jgi:hypothetical protein